MCQCPVSGESHFYESTTPAEDNTGKQVSMPCLGRIPFLLLAYGVTRRSNKQCVNALSRANPISTDCMGIFYACFCKCQCPVSGESHFYPGEYCIKEVQYGLCQCPVSGESHFYDRRGEYYAPTVRFVSMPCLGRIPFLQRPSGSRINRASWKPFLQVIHRIF